MNKKADPAIAAILKSEEVKKARPTPKQWAEAEALWESGAVTKVGLAKKLNVSCTAVLGHMKRHGVSHASKSNEHKKRVSEEVGKALVTDATILAARIKETKEEHYKMAAGLAKLSWAEILTAKQNNAPFSAAINNLKALDAAMTVIKKAREERWAVLGLDSDDYIDEDGLPELLISELTAEQIKELRERDHTEFDNLPNDPIQDADIDDMVEED
jgi:hypothetical protein